jgi:hypothetical protein
MEQVSAFCRSCSAEISWHHNDLGLTLDHTIEFVVGAWNTRPDTDRIAALEAEVFVLSGWQKDALPLLRLLRSKLDEPQEVLELIARAALQENPVAALEEWE